MLDTITTDDISTPRHVELVLLNNANRRVNLQSIDLMAIEGFNPALNAPQTASLTYQMIFGSYASNHQIKTTATYLAEIPAIFNADTSISTLSEFVRDAVFDITVTDSKVLLLEPKPFTRQPYHSFDINVDPLRLNTAIKSKFQGDLPSSNGFDSQLVSEISSIVRSKLSNKLMMQVGNRATSIEKTVDIVNGMGKAINAAVKWGVNYKLVTTTDEVNQNYHPKPSVSVILSLILSYEAGYNLSFDVTMSADIPFGKPAPIVGRVSKFLSGLDFNYKVHEVDISRNNDTQQLVDPDFVNNLFFIFDADKAASMIQGLVSGVEQPSNQAMQDILTIFHEKTQNSIYQRMTSDHSVRVDLI